MLEYLPMVASAAGLVRVAAAVVLPGLSVGRVDAPPSPRLVLRLLQLLLQLRRLVRVRVRVRVGVRVKVRGKG